MTTDREARIAVIDNECPRVLAKLEEVHERWMAAATRWLRDVYDSDIAKAIKANPDRVHELAATSALSELKASLQAEKDGLEKRVTDTFRDNAGYWSHVGGQVFDSVGSGMYVPKYDALRVEGSEGSKKFDGKVRLLRGRVLGLLDTAGLSDEAPGQRRVDSEGGYRYPYAMTYSNDLNAANKEYRDAYKEFVELVSEREDLKREMSEASAEGLWDSA